MVDESVEEFVDRDEIRAAHVPVRLLAVHGQGLHTEDDGSEELGRGGCRGRIGRGGRSGLRVCHLRLRVERIRCRPARPRFSRFNGTQPRTFRKQDKAGLTRLGVGPRSVHGTSPVSG
ncbi:hypothetical protein GCM10009777_27130 [Microbacterium pumilum]|uniref:Uncharacterized protein n=1 Tax=Microbacterium pumilum TaxID=344165 RepID=A0ABP5E2A9_9MICO